MNPTDPAPAEPHPDRAGGDAETDRTAFRDLFDRGPHPMWIHDPETLRILAANRAMEAACARPRRALLGTPLHQVLDPVPVAGPADPPSTAGSEPASRSVSLSRLGRADGAGTWVEVVQSRVDFGARRAVLACAHEVSDGIRAEHALRESEQRFRFLFDQSPIGVLHFDAGLRVLGCNRPLADALGAASPEELIGFDLERLRDRRVLPVLRQAVAGERSQYEGPYRATHRDGVVWISVQASPLRGEGSAVLGGIAVIEDITPRRRVQTRLAQQSRALHQANRALRERTRELEAALQSRNKLHAALNHELRTPISAIMLHHELLLGGALGTLSPDQHASVGHAQRAAQHLLALVQDVLDLASLHAGKLRLEPERVELGELLAEVATTIRPLADDRGSDLALRPSGADCTLVTDVRRVRQIVLNLLTNALKFGEGRPVALEWAALPDGGAEITVADRGRGITPADQQRIFEDFVQLGSPAEGGTGLGLSISRWLADLLGASLTVQSEPGSGSTFRLRLPPEPPAHHAPDAE